MAEVSPLRWRMIEDMTIRNLSPATQQSYIYAVAKFSRHCGRSPERLGLEDVRAYQLHLIAQQRSWSHINQVVCALRIFYGITLGRSDSNEQIVAAREPQRLPVVLSGEEIARFLEAVPGPEAFWRLAKMTCEPVDLSDAGDLCSGSEVADRHVLDHATAKGAHNQLLCEKNGATWRRRIASQLRCETGGRRSVVTTSQSNTENHSLCHKTPAEPVSPT
jgi:integrase/recombinase XerD